MCHLMGSAFSVDVKIILIKAINENLEIVREVVI